MTKTLDVLVDGQLIGCLHDKNPLTFTYSENCLIGLLRSPFSGVIPLTPGDIATPAVLAYFENLLPEGDQRRALEERNHVSSVFGLLETAGWDTAGSIVLKPTGSISSAPAYIRSSWPQIAQIIAGHGAPLDGYKASISGAQYKILLSLANNGTPLLPVGASPSTHILKPDIRRVGQTIWASAVNEAIVMRAAGKCGLPTAHVYYIPSVKSCLVERYDRKTSADEVVRINQADLCQLLKMPSDVKYELDGGPGFAACYNKVQSLSAKPVVDCENLLKWLFFNLYVGNNDSHAKNISMLQTSEGDRLAPFYDLMCTAVYPGFSRNFAFNVGGTFKPAEIGATELKHLADSINVSERYMTKLAKSMSERIPPAMTEATLDLHNSFDHSEKTMAERLRYEVSSICKKRSAKFFAHDNAKTDPSIVSTLQVGSDEAETPQGLDEQQDEQQDEQPGRGV